MNLIAEVERQVLKNLTGDKAADGYAADSKSRLYQNDSINAGMRDTHKNGVQNHRQ